MNIVPRDLGSMNLLVCGEVDCVRPDTGWQTALAILSRRCTNAFPGGAGFHSRRLELKTVKVTSKRCVVSKIGILNC